MDEHRAVKRAPLVSRGPGASCPHPPTSRRLTYLALVQALVDAPGEVRKVVNFKRLALTDFKLDIPRLAKKSVLTQKFAEAGERDLR